MLYERETIEWSNFWWENANKECRRLLLIGDSVTRGYRSSLNDFFTEYDCVVDICAFSASISNTLTERMIKSFFSFDEYVYEYIGVQVGGQHGFRKKCCSDSKEREQFKKSYLKCIDEISKYAKNLFLISYTPTVLKDNLYIYDEERNRELMCRNEIAKEVAEERGYLYFDLWNIVLNSECVHTDYIHFDKEANQYIAEHLGKEIVTKMNLVKGEENVMKKTAGAILSLASGAVGAAVGAGVMMGKLNKKIDWRQSRIDKFKSYFDIMNQWMIWKNSGRNLSEYFEMKGYKKIIIYGMGELGCRLYEELKDTDIEIAYAIDKNGGNGLYPEIKVVDIEDIEETADVIVVTPVFAYDSVEELLMDKVDMPVISLEEVVYDM